MSTLVIEGGRPLSGSVEVEGNKNAALPLLAACLLTTEECILHNVPRISDVEVMARLLLDLGAEVEGIGGPTLRVRCPAIVRTSRTARWSAGSEAPCCFLARCWRGGVAPGSRLQVETFRHAARSRRTSTRWCRWVRASWTDPGMNSKCQTA